MGVAIARAGRERRPEPEPGPDRALGLLPGESVGAGLRRMALGQVEMAIEMLEGASSDPGTAVHETRKALKRLRALVRVLESELGRKTAAREDRALAETARLLAGARDGEVLLATLDSLVERHPGKLAGRKSVARLRRSLAAEHERAMRRALEDPANRARAIGELRAVRERLLVWNLSDRHGIAVVEPGLLRLYSQGRKRWERCERRKGDETREMHLWRKRVKDLRYVAEMLDTREAAANGTRSRREPQQLGRVASRADSLGELLGEDHDLAVLADWIRRNGKRRRTRVGRKTRRTLLKLIARRRRQLRRQALRKGERLYRARPKKFLRRVRASQRRSA